jgi:hypothetical protein
VIKDPPYLGTREVGVHNQAGTLAEEGLEPALLEVVAEGNRLPGLPDDGPVDRLTGPAIPDHSRFALVGDSDGRDLVEARARLRDGLA